MREQELHTAAAQFLSMALPDGALHTAIDAAGKTSKVAGAMFKARGGIKGFPDHVIFWSGKTVTVEFKAMKGRLSPEQIAVGEKLKANGVGWYVVRSLMELQMALADAGIPTRAKLS